MTDRELLRHALKVLEDPLVIGPDGVVETVLAIRARLTTPEPHLVEREACARLCDEIAANYNNPTASECATAIRSRT